MYIHVYICIIYIYILYMYYVIMYNIHIYTCKCMWVKLLLQFLEVSKLPEWSCKLCKYTNHDTNKIVAELM